MQNERHDTVIEITDGEDQERFVITKEKPLTTVARGPFYNQATKRKKRELDKRAVDKSTHELI